MKAPINAAGPTNARLVADIIAAATAVLQTHAPRGQIGKSLRASRDCLRLLGQQLQKKYPAPTKRA